MKRSQIRFEFEVEIVGGEEGQVLRLEQARAIRNILMWLQKQGANAFSEPNHRWVPTDQDVD